MIDIVQSDFGSGMNLFTHDAALNPEEYGLAFNVTNRTSALEALKDDLEDDEAPDGKKQGLFAFDRYLVLFNAGLCYYRNVDDAEWTQIEDIFVDSTVDYIFAQAVPASTFNFKRVLSIPDQIDGTGANTNITVQPVVISPTLSGLVVQDGINQGWFISPTAVASRLNRYSEWTTTDRSYVPIMRQMAFINGILFGISPDRKKLFRSVSGRPLDFVVNIDVNGDKGGNADTVSYAVSYDDINCIRPLNSGELLVATHRNCFPIEFNYDKLIFQEPTFLNRKPISAGVVNQESFIDILGDYAFIDFDGLRSFNAVAMLTNEGRNSIFSLFIANAFRNVKQEIIKSASIVFDNYAIFSLKTIYGSVLAVYDTLRQKWNSFVDLDAPIKQFAISDTADNPTLFGITETKVLKLFSSSTYREARVRFKAVNSAKASSEILLKNVRAVFDSSTSISPVTATEIVNNRVRNSVIISDVLGRNPPGILYPVMYPITYYSTGTTDVLNFNFERLSKIGWKVSPEVRWQNDAKLLMLQTQVEEQTQTTALRQQGSLYTSGTL